MARRLFINDRGSRLVANEEEGASPSESQLPQTFVCVETEARSAVGRACRLIAGVARRTAGGINNAGLSQSDAFRESPSTAAHRISRETSQEDMHPTTLVILVVVYVRSTAGKDTDMLRLYRKLLYDYEADVRPAANHSSPLNVTFGFSLTQIIDVDERNQILTTNTWVNQNWVDYKLRWDPKEYGNITVMHIPHQRLWRPDIVLYNNADSHYTTSVMSTDIFVNYDGNVTWLAAAIFKSSCHMNVRYYPFDEQTCLLKFASWAYDGTKIDLILISEEGDETNYMTSTEWHLISIRAQKKNITYSCCPEPYPFIDVYIHIRRRPMFYVFNLILPCVLISLIALLGFYMPSDSGEKVTLGITTLLSMTVFLMLVAESMPPTSDTLPLIGMYYGVTICIVSLATAMTVFTLNLHHTGQRGSSVPPLVKRIFLGNLARMLCIQIKQFDSLGEHTDRQYRKYGLPEGMPGEENEFDPMILETRRHNGGLNSPYDSPTIGNDRGASSMTKYTSTRCDEFEMQFLRVLNRVHGAIERNEIRLNEGDRRDAIKLEWQQVALVLDRFLLLIFVVGTAVISFAILHQREQSSG
uniref:Uncharacterized protein n=1 Tax=Plectus sambesii TaxID=2011161 RepID=A0A914W783_9BILA